MSSLRRLAEAATPGPWTAHSDGLVWCTDDAPGDPVSGSTEYADAAYIAAASPDVILALLDRAEQAESTVERLRGALETLMKSADDYEAAARAGHVWDEAGPTETVIRGIQQYRAALTDTGEKP